MEHDFQFLIQTVKNGYKLLFESSHEYDITNEFNPRWNAWKLSLLISGSEIAYVIYTINPIIVYTTREGRNPEDYIYIEMIYCDEKFRRKGYATIVLKELLNIKAEKYPNKTIIVRCNNYSKDLIRKFGFIDLANEKND